MMGLIILIVFGLYLAFSIWVVWGTVRWAKRRQRRAWVWGILATLVMYHLVFWDLIPTKIAHQYYCDKYAGLKVYKTIEQWQAENPGADATLIPNPKWDISPVFTNEMINYTLNDRFVLSDSNTKEYFGIEKHNSKIIDVKTNELIIERIDFSTNVRPIAVSAKSIRDFKFWLAVSSCEQTDHHEMVNDMKNYISKFKNMGREL